MKPIFVRESPGSLKHGHGVRPQTPTLSSSVTPVTAARAKHIRVNVVQQRLAEHIQVSRLHGVMGNVKHEEVNSRLRWPQLGETRESADTLKGRLSTCLGSLTCSWKHESNPIPPHHSLIPCTDFDTCAIETLITKLHCGYFSFCSSNSLEKKSSFIVTLFQHTMYSEGAMNSIVAFWTSGLLCGSPYDLLTGLYINSSGTAHTQTNTHT